MASNNGYSAQVALTLFINGLQLPVSHVGTSGLIVTDECDPQPPSNATLRVDIGERSKDHGIFLPEGIPGPGRFVPFY